MKNDMTSLGAFCLVGVVLAALFCILSGPAAMEMDMTQRLGAPSMTHPFGTDAFGRDMLAMASGGLIASLVVALLGVLSGAIAGGGLGLALAMGGRNRFGALGLGFSDVLFMFPAFLTALMLNTLYGPSAVNVVAALALISFPVFFRQSFVLGQSLLATPHMKATEALGQTRWGVLRRHLLPAISGIWLTQVSLQLGLALLTESSLSYLGLGLPYDVPSLGRMLQESQSYLGMAPRLAVVPGLAIALLVFCFYVIGDGLRDRSDIRRLQRFDT